MRGASAVAAIAAARASMMFLPVSSGAVIAVVAGWQKCRAHPCFCRPSGSRFDTAQNLGSGTGHRGGRCRRGLSSRPRRSHRWRSWSCRRWGWDHAAPRHRCGRAARAAFSASSAACARTAAAAAAQGDLGRHSRPAARHSRILEPEPVRNTNLKGRLGGSAGPRPPGWRARGAAGAGPKREACGLGRCNSRGARASPRREPGTVLGSAAPPAAAHDASQYPNAIDGDLGQSSGAALTLP